MLTRRQVSPWDHLNAQEAHKEVSYYRGGVLCKSEGLVRPRCALRKVLAERVSEIFLTSVLCSL